MSLQYIGLDVHKKWIVYCVKDASGKTLEESRIKATKEDVAAWCAGRTEPWNGLMEATMFSGWIYDAMVGGKCEKLRVGHPERMKQGLPVKNKSDREDARRFADLCRCGLMPYHPMLRKELRELRRLLRLRNLFKMQRVQLKNRVAGALMEEGVQFDAKKVYSKRRYEEVQQNPALSGEVKAMLRMCHNQIERLGAIQKAILKRLEKEKALAERVKGLRSIPGVGLILALTWALEIGEVERFSSAGDAMSYCGLVAAQNESAGKNRSGPLSRKRNPRLQTMLIEVAHLAPRYNWLLAKVKEEESKRLKPNVVAVAVARKLVSYLMAVDRSRKDFQMPPNPDQPVEKETAAGSEKVKVKVKVKVKGKESKSKPTGSAKTGMGKTTQVGSVERGGIAPSPFAD